MFIARFFRQTTKSASQNKSVQNGVFREWFFCVNMSRWSWHLMWIEEDKLEIIFLESKQTSFDELIALQRPIGAIKLVSLRFFLFDTYLLERCEMNSKTCVLFCKNIMPTIRIFMFKISLINLSAHLQMTWWHITKYTNQKEQQIEKKRNTFQMKCYFWIPMADKLWSVQEEDEKKAFQWIKSKDCDKMQERSNKKKKNCLGFCFEHVNFETEVSWCKCLWRTMLMQSIPFKSNILEMATMPICQWIYRHSTYSSIPSVYGQ